MLKNRVREHTSRELALVGYDVAFIILDYLSHVDSADVMMTIIHLFGPLFDEKERWFPSEEWQDKSILNPKFPVWGKEFNDRRASHHAACGSFMLEFINKHSFLIE